MANPTIAMCVCRDLQLMAELGTDNVFVWHLDRKTGEPCPGVPREPDERHSELLARLMVEVGYHVEAQKRLRKHSMFAYPHLWPWHALFDGTWVCRCWHSREMKEQRE